VAQRARLLDLHTRLCELLLHDSLVGQRTAERDAVTRTIDGQCDRPLSGAEGTHAMMDPARSQPRLRRGESAALLTEQVGGRHSRLIEDDLGVAVLIAVPEDG
jgi:hypothetical protein